MKHEVTAGGSAFGPELLEDGQAVLPEKAEVATSEKDAGTAKQEAKDLETAETLEYRYYPTELSDEELMNLDFAGC